MTLVDMQYYAPVTLTLTIWP